MRKTANFYFFKRKPLPKINRYEHWRGTAEIAGLSSKARLRLEWIIFYYTAGKHNVRFACKHFGISRKTFYKWFNRFKDNGYDVKELENQSRAPHRRRKWEVSLEQETKVKLLRKKYMHYGKIKLKVLYKKEYGEEISCWKIERVIRKHKLYPDKIKAEKTAKKIARAKQNPKKRITQLVKENKLWFLLQVDTIVIYWGNVKRYILTAVDHASKLGYARMYKTHSSKAAADFLYRLQYLINQQIMNLQTDNGSEFANYFEQASVMLGIQRYFSRVRTPKDNPEVERFNRTLKYEWLYDCNLTTDCDEFNPAVTDWLIEYNFNRPHQALDYLTPMGYIENCNENLKQKVLPMCPASTMHRKSIRIN